LRVLFAGTYVCALEDANVRVLVACPACNRQSDAGDLEVGRKFRCACGQVLEVPRVRAKDAAVVRCSSCGGPRQEGAAHCTFCGADFTVHEQDLDTICPTCMARIMRTARFCQQCGTRIAVEGKSGTPTEHPCPACGGEHPLDSRTLGTPPVGILECRACAGLWIGVETFEVLTDRMKVEAAKQVAEAPTGARPSGSPGKPTVAAPGRQGPLYRSCPMCKTMMARRNYAHTSGVIVDVCNAHGTWFDAGELQALLEWMRRGGLENEARLEKEEAAAAAKRARMPPTRLDRMAAQGGVRNARGGGLFDPGSSETNVIAAILKALFKAA
jgi:Zn-finger nucleic acid-binding protein